MLFGKRGRGKGRDNAHCAHNLNCTQCNRICSKSIRCTKRAWRQNTYIIPNYNQQDATFLDLFISTDALHVSGGSSAHEENITVHTASGIVNQYCCLLQLAAHWLTIPEAVYTVMCSWWWEEEPPETCRTSVEINKSRKVVSCWL